MPSDDLDQVLAVITDLARQATADATASIPARAGMVGERRVELPALPLTGAG